MHCGDGPQALQFKVQIGDNEMKKYILTAILATSLAAPVSAADRRAEICPLIEGLAEVIMEGRQLGASMSQMMAIWGADDMAGVADIGREMVLAAYDQPQWATDQSRERATVEFKNDIALVCWGR